MIAELDAIVERLDELQKESNFKAYRFDDPEVVRAFSRVALALENARHAVEGAGIQYKVYVAENERLPETVNA